MKGLILLADYFEDIEALATNDLLRRAKISTELVSMTNSRTVMSQSGLKLQVRKLFTEIKFEDFDFLVIPGGKAVSLMHLESKDTQSAIKYFQENNKLICAICAAPAVLGKYGLLDGKKFTCFPSFEKYAPKGKYLPKKTVVQDGNIITSKAAGTTFDFAYKIVSYLLGKDAAKRLAKEIYS